MSKHDTEIAFDDVPTDDDALPAEVRVRSHDGDAWYEYDGELLFSEEVVVALWERYQDMAEDDWERVNDMGSSGERLKVRTKDVPDIEADLEARFDEVDEEFGFIMKVESLFSAHHGVTEEGPRKSVAWASYQAGGPAMLGGADYKREKLLKPIRDYEQWVYHNRVWLPVVEPYHEEYPY